MSEMTNPLDLVKDLMPKHEQKKEVKLENVRTQSMVESSRESAEKEYDANVARLKAEQRREEYAEKIDTAAKATGRTAIYTIIIVIVLLTIPAGVWFAYNAFRIGRKPIEYTNGNAPSGENGGSTGSLGDYKCRTSDCSLVKEIDDERIVVQDGGYYLYNKTSDERYALAFSSDESFVVDYAVYGGVEYLVLTNENGKKALFNLTSNRTITETTYTEFYLDIKNDIYKSMTWVEGKYLIAKDSRYRLIDVRDGKVLVSGGQRVALYGYFGFGFEENGQRIAYTADGKQIRTIDSNKLVFLESDALIVVDKDTLSTNIYGPNGEADAEHPVFKKYSSTYAENYLKTLRETPGNIEVPLN